MENLNTSEISNLLFLVSKIRKESSDIALNDYYQAMSKHDVFCKTLGISNTPFASDRLSRLKASGLASVYKSLPAEIRFFSADSTDIPNLPIIIEKSRDVMDLPSVPANSSVLKKNSGGSLNE